MKSAKLYQIATDNSDNCPLPFLTSHQQTATLEPKSQKGANVF